MSAHEAWWAEVEDVRARIEARRSSDEPFPPRLRALEGGRSSRPVPAGTTAVAQAPARPRRRTVEITGRGAPAPAPRPLAAAPAPRPLPRPVARATAHPDRIALWAVMLALVMLLVSVGTAGAATSLGERTLKTPMEGRDVRGLQGALKHLGLLHAPATAHFGTLTRGAVVRFQRSRCLTADGIAGPATIRALLDHAPRCAGGMSGGARVRGRLAHLRVVTWYGPGLYGRSTACGRKLTRNLIGLAHRTLPCGTIVTLAHGSHVVHATVVDRGPHTDGVDYDLTWGAARALGVLAAGRASVRSNH